jgi:hypothetical protein
MIKLMVLVLIALFPWPVAILVGALWLMIFLLTTLARCAGWLVKL